MNEDVLDIIMWRKDVEALAAMDEHAYSEAFYKVIIAARATIKEDSHGN